MQKFIGEQKGLCYCIYVCQEYSSEDATSGCSFDPNEKDQLLKKWRELFLQQKVLFILQSQLKLGVQQNAGRIMDQLEAAGIVGSFNGKSKRSTDF